MRARFVLTRGNNFLGLIANYVTHCVSLNMILSKHSCFGLKQIGIMGSARSRVGIENFNGKQDRYIFIERILEALETLSRRCLLFLPRVMAIKIIKCLYTRAYAQLYVPALTRLLPLFLTYRIFRDRIFRKRSIEHTHSSIPPFLLKFRVSKQSCKEMIANFRFEISNFLRHAIFSRISRRLPVQTLILFFNPLF